MKRDYTVTDNRAAKRFEIHETAILPSKTTSCSTAASPTCTPKCRPSCRGAALLRF